MKYKYTTLKGLISKTRQFNLNNFLNMRIYHKDKGHINIKLSDDLNKQIEFLFCDFLNLNYLNYNKSYGLFDRLIIDKNLKVCYIAGQNYPTELKYLRGLLK
jgi:hypothetical protein